MKDLWIEYDYAILEDSRGRMWIELLCWINPAGLDSRRIPLNKREATACRKAPWQARELCPEIASVGSDPIAAVALARRRMKNPIGKK